jgi:flagellar hook-associated protein 2
MGMALSGLASGFDWKSIVDQLIEVSRAPQSRMKKEQSANSVKTSALNEIKGLLSSLKSSVSSLASTQAIQKKSATFENTSTNWTASANTNASAGTYKFEILSEATASKLDGAVGIASRLDAAFPPGFPITTPLSSLPIGRTITGGIFTVNGVQIHNGVNPDTGELIKFTTADSLDTVLNRITALTSVSATYDPIADKIDLVSSSPITLGASNDNSNFLQAMRLSSGGSTVSSSSTLSSPRLNDFIDSANLSGWSGSAVSDSIIINGESISYNSGSDTIQTLLNRINDSKAGVTATFDLSAGKFVLTNKQTGNVGISVSDGMGVGGLAAAMGLTTGTISSGADAEFTINGGGSLFSRSNTLDETAHGITGLSVTAKKDSVTASNNTQTITVGSDTTAAKDAINDFISKYNAVQGAIEKYTKITVDGTKVSSAVLAGSRELASMSRELRKILYETGKDASGNDLTGTVKRISDLGVGSSGIENTISITNSTTLDSRLSSNAEDVINYFTTATNGFSARLGSMLDRLTSDSSTTPGVFKVQLDNITKQNKSLDKQIEDVERRLASQRSLLESSFIAMERAQSGFQQQSAYLAKTFNNSK